MTTSSNNANKPETNAQLAADYVTKMQADIAQATVLIAQLKALFPQAQQLSAIVAFLTQFFGADCNITKQYQAQLDQLNAAMKGIEAQLNTLGAGLDAFDNAITALENGTATVFADGDGNIDEDLQIFANAFDKICQAMMDKLVADEYGAKMDADGDDNQALEQDSVAAMKASSAENGVLNDLQQDIGQALVTLNNQKNAAQTDLDSYHWWDDVFSLGSDESAKDEDRAIIRNSNDMRTILTGILSDLAPEMGACENMVYETASLALGKLLDKLMKLLANTTISPESKLNQIKCLVAVALGILAEVQTDAAKMKAKDQQTESKSATFATEMNISDEKAQFDQLQEELKYASIMKTIMAIAKPLMEVGGMLLAPGLGSFLVMAALMIMDEAGLTDKLTNVLASHGFGQIGAEIFVGALELVATVGGGMVLDNALEEAEKVVVEVVAVEVAAVVSKIIEETVQKTLEAAGKVGDKVAEAAVREAVTQAVNKAVETAAEKSVIIASKQSAAKLLPALTAASKTSGEGVGKSVAEQASAQGASGYSTRLAQVAAPNAVAAAESAATKAASDIQFLAEAAANGADVSTVEINAVANRASNEAIAKATDSSIKEVESAGAKQSNLNKFGSRVVAPAAYVALSDGAISSLTEYELKKSGHKKDSDYFQRIMETIKIIESILASMAVAGGTGLFSSVSSMSLAGNATTKAMIFGQAVGMIGTSMSAYSMAGQADSEMEQAETVKAINASSVSNEMLNMFMQQFTQQGDIDRKTLENQMSEQASNYTLISQYENNAKALSQVLAQSAV